MKTPDDYSISMAYSYENSQELAMYYDDSAKDYDGFVDSVGYVLPRKVAEIAAIHLNEYDTVIDIGCGTGILGIELNSLKYGPYIHGVDISSEMISIAYRKQKPTGVRYYEKLYHIDISGKNALPKNKYDLMVSSGTFTTGHLDGGHLSKIMESMKAGSFAVFSVKSDHFYDSGFMRVLLELQRNKLIEIIDISEVDSYENSGYSALSKIISIKIN
jgi:predicted TPR repeat methyltransferase